MGSFLNNAPRVYNLFFRFPYSLLYSKYLLGDLNKHFDAESAVITVWGRSTKKEKKHLSFKRLSAPRHNRATQLHLNAQTSPDYRLTPQWLRMWT